MYTITQDSCIFCTLFQQTPDQIKKNLYKLLYTLNYLTDDLVLKSW